MPALRLVNTAAIELWPACLCRAKTNAHARLIALGDTVLRRKHDGRYLAVAGGAGLRALVPALSREPGLHAALHELGNDRSHPRGDGPPGVLDASALQAGNAAMGLASDYAEATGLPFHPEPRLLHYAGRDRWGRPLWLLGPTARAWRAMVDAARHDDITLEAISGYRSHAYQRGIVERKRARGLALDAILRVNAAPGHSEHHSGRAIDIGTPGEPAAEESFESTPAFAWLQAHAADFGFRLSYPRGNPHGITYEPWHWCWQPPSRG